MTAVLSAGDPLRLNRMMSSMDDNQSNYSSGDSEHWKAKYKEAARDLDHWKAKYQDEADRQMETLDELVEFQRSSKELEEELEKDAERNEKIAQELRTRLSRVELERDEWKSKFMQLQTNHNTTTTSLQRELDTLRQTHQVLTIQLRELELGNDDLERNERAVSSSLADTEAKYSKALEEKILLEQELFDKASLEEECQRLRDEIRDANLEVTVVKDRFEQAQNHIKALSRSSTTESSTSSTKLPAGLPLPEDDLIKTTPPSELLLSDLIGRKSSTSTISLSSESSARSEPMTKKPAKEGQSALLKRAGFPAAWMNGSQSPTQNTSSMTRSRTIASYSPSRLPTTPRPHVTQRLASEAMTASTTSVASTSATASKSRGVQMVSEMRAKVRNLEQRLHTRVPRLRLTSLSGRNALSSTSSVSTPENPRTSLQRQSADLDAEKKKAPSGQKSRDSSGWVLIMEDSMTPTPTKDKDGRRRLSSPSSSPIYSAMTSGKAESAGASHIDLTRSNIGRSQSRLSGPTDGRDSISTESTTSSIQTPNSRPATPTFLPLPTAGLYGHGLPTMKRSTGPGQAKRTSLGSNPDSPTFLQAPTVYRERPLSTQSSFAVSTNKSLPAPPNVTVRSSRPPSALGQSRIGRPTSLGAGRKSGGNSDNEGLQPTKDGRSRAGSTAASNKPGNRAL